MSPREATMRTGPKNPRPAQRVPAPAPAAPVFSDAPAPALSTPVPKPVVDTAGKVAPTAGSAATCGAAA
ncbi:MAG: hypothetical protein DRJ42_23335 [Deltaproteobacteria bacterium]|nr:MAG: hypothetical protein DRJ42_23335 [Deltaproteobacteria bacterium]